MFSKCVRNVLTKRKAFNAAKNVYSTRPLGAKDTVILRSSSQGHFTKAPVRLFSVSYYQKQEFRCAEDVKHMVEAKGDLQSSRVSEKMAMKTKKRDITRFFPHRSNTLDDDVLSNMIYDGFDVIVQARAGSEKIKSYAIPLVEKLLSESASTSKHIKMVVVTPTRELSDLVAGVIRSHARELNVVSMNKGTAVSDECKRGIDILVGTPIGIHKTSLAKYTPNHVVFHDVDTMLNMGFTYEIEAIFKLLYRTYKKNENPQTLFFSTTFPSWVRNATRMYFSHYIEMVDSDRQKKNITLESIDNFNFEKNVFEKDINDLRNFFENVPESNKVKFDKLAEELMKDSDPVNILATTLAVAAGYEQKSLINFKPGFVTLKFTLNTPVYGNSTNLLPVMLANKAINIKGCCKSFVFDVPLLLAKKYMGSRKYGYDDSISVIERLT